MTTTRPFRKIFKAYFYVCTYVSLKLPGAGKAVTAIAREIKRKTFIFTSRLLDFYCKIGRKMPTSLFIYTTYFICI